MYIPRFNAVVDRATLIEAMRRWSFATVIGPGADGALMATHLPLMVTDAGEHGLIEGHFARANGHWKGLAGGEALVVFQGPHSYVSPTLYVEEKSVPTWNYIAVHAYGRLELVEDERGKNDLVRRLMGIHEAGMIEAWDGQAERYREGMLMGIVGFRLEIGRIEGKFKVSQNRLPEERAAVRAAMAAGSAEERELAEWMVRLEGKAGH